MERHATRRRFLALTGLLVSSVAARPLRAQDFTPSGVVSSPNSSPPSSSSVPGLFQNEEVQEVGSWRVASQGLSSTARVLPADLRTAPAGQNGVDSVDLALSYSADSRKLAGTLAVKLAPTNFGPLPVGVYADGNEVGSFDASGGVDYQLTDAFGDQLESLKGVHKLEVGVVAGNLHLNVLEATLDGTADAISAMRDRPDLARQVMENMQLPSHVGPPPSPSGPPSGGCFLTAACCGLVGLPDDCVELTTLRRFRDGVMMATAGGRADVARYYALAPAILTEIARRGEERLLLRLYFSHIVPSVIAAQLGREPPRASRLHRHDAPADGSLPG